MVRAVVSSPVPPPFFKGRKFPQWIIHLEQKWFLSVGLAPTFIHVGTFYLSFYSRQVPLCLKTQGKKPNSLIYSHPATLSQATHFLTQPHLQLQGSWSWRKGGGRSTGGCPDLRERGPWSSTLGLPQAISKCQQAQFQKKTPFASQQVGTQWGIKNKLSKLTDKIWQLPVPGNSWKLREKD